MKVGKYTITGRLGRGGMGLVYKATMPMTGKVVALKVCRPVEILVDMAGVDNIREMFLREAVAMANIRHPNIASVLDVGEAEVEDLGRMPFFAMEYYCTNLGQVMGEDYEVEKPSRQLSVAVAVGYGRQIFEGLRRLHFAGLVHRDVKPFNVMLTDEDQCKLIDFGLSKLRGETEKRPQGMVVGSPYYTAPEQEADADQADERSDLFSVGVTLFRMLTGYLPETEAGEKRVASALCPDLDSQWDAFLEKSMHPAPDKRFQSASEAINALDELAEQWERKQAEACAFVVPDDESSQATGIAEPKSIPLRTTSRKVGPKEGREIFGLDELWHPKTLRAHCFESRLESGGEVVVDRGAGLVWQRSGSDYPLDYESGQQYVAKLAENRYANRSGWRVPTVAELLSLFRSEPEPGEFCLPPVFDPTQERLWSADTKAFTAAWYANASKGFVWWQDKTCRFFVRAVCTDESVRGAVRCEVDG